MGNAVNNVASHGGRCEFPQCDHSDDVAVEAVFKSIFDTEGHLDLLVNNAFGGQDNGNVATKSIGEPFWQKPIWLWDAQSKSACDRTTPP